MEDKYIALHDAIKKLMSEYANMYEYAKLNKKWDHPFKEIVSSEIPTLLTECASLTYPYRAYGSYGKGTWTFVPWIAIFDTRITTSAQKGVYIVYLLNKDTKDLYLTLEIAATEAYAKISKNDDQKGFRAIVKGSQKRIKEPLQERAQEIRTAIDDHYFCQDDNIHSGSDGYDYGTVYYKRYTLDDLPDGKTLVDDLNKMIAVYKKYYEWYTTGQVSTHEEEGEVTMTTAETIKKINTYIASRGFTYNDSLIENFYLSLKSKPFVILAGTSGTGKTRLVKLFAEAIGAEYKLVSVRPDWSDGSDLFGHYDLNGNFINGPVCDCFDQAYNNPNKPVFLCLDEMNLARVEYYLSDFLSVIESREKTEDGKVITSPIAQYKQGIPDNLYVVGTVNMDETTFPFSKKVLDRANTIEFSYVDLNPSFDTVGEDVEPLNLSNDFLRTEYLVLNRDCADEQEYVTDICLRLNDINKILQTANAHIGYRVRDEIVFYMLNNKKEGNLLNDNDAFDYELMQKILPRIQGSSASVKDMLYELFKVCAVDPNQKTGDTDSEKMKKVLDDPSITCKYRKSAEKLELMVRRFEEDGFTSYWL